MLKKIISLMLAISLVLTLPFEFVSAAEDYEINENIDIAALSEEIVSADEKKSSISAMSQDDEIPALGHRVLNYHFVDNNITMTDEELFGKYDAETQTWTIPSKFDYDAFPNMNRVKEAAMNANGDYSAAKVEFKEYYKEKKRSFNIVAPNDSAADTKAALLNSEQMYFGQGTTLLDIISMNNESSTVEIDITDKVKSTQSLDVKNLVVVVMGLRKDGSSAEIDSRESGINGPTIDVRLATGASLSFTAQKDTYVSAGDNRNKSYGTETVLKAEESVSSIGTDERVDTNTKRTSILFNMDGRLTADDNVQSATLKLHGKNAAQTGKMYLALFFTNTANWTENSTWVNYPNGQIAFSYYGEEYQLNHKVLSKSADIYPNANFRYTEDICRNMFYMPFYNRYYYTRDEFYAQAYVKTVGDFMLQHPGGAAVNKTLDLANRRLFATQLPVIIDSEYATPEWVAALAKHVWGAADYMKTRFTSISNWGTAEATQLYAIGSFFPEFKDAYDWTQNMSTDGGLKSTAYRVKYLLDQNVRDDFSCSEHAGAYVDYFIQTITSIFSIGKVTGASFVLDEETSRKLINAARYLADISSPGFHFSQWGDEGGYTGKYAQLLSIGEEYDDPVLLYAGGDIKNGEKPSHTSVFYPDGKIAVMRTGWSEDSYYMLTDFGGRNVHGHDDDLALIIFAKGKYLLTDQSMGDYNSEQQNTLITQESHNVVITDGAEQLSAENEGIAGKTNDWVTNESFDFLAGTIKDKANNSWKRNVMFIRGKYWIVTDYMTPADLTKDTSYRQLWHMLASANPTFDENKILKSQFDDVNIKVIPLEAENLQCNILTGIQGGSGGVKDAPYGEYSKTQKGITTFNTVLFPESASENARIETSKIVLADVYDNGASAMNFKISAANGNIRTQTDSVYYIVNDEGQIKEREIGNLIYDGKMLYRENDENGNYLTLNIYQGSKLSDTSGKTLFQYSSSINDFAVEYGGKAIYISSSLPSEAINWSDLTFAKQQEIKNVYYNDEPMTFKQTDNYIYFGDNPIIRDTVTSSSSDSSGSGVVSTPPAHGTTGNSGVSGGAGGSGGISPGITDNTGLKLNKDSSATYMQGYGDGTIRPDASITRAEAITALYRIVENKADTQIGEAKFSDVQSDHFAYEAITFMEKNEIISGYEDGTFKPESGITRGELAKIISYFVSDNTAAPSCPYTDIASTWAKPYIEKVYRAGLIKGYPDNTYRSDDFITRAEFIVIINRALDREINADISSELDEYYTDIDSTHWAFADIIEATVEKTEENLTE